MDLSYIINELGEERHQYFNAIAPPIIQTSNFAFDTVDDLRNAFRDEMAGYIYSRGINPTVDILREKLAALDGAEDCLVFNNGAAAIFAGVFAHVKTGDHIVSVQHPYSWAAHLFDKVLPRFGISTTYIDGTSIENFERAILPNTRLIYLESPNSWFFDLQDLSAVAELARSEGIVTFIDNSYCTPLYQQPIKMGIDLAMQTATKFIGGHSDTLGGVLSGSGEMIRKIFDSEFLCVGSGIQPFNAWMLLRGLRTLPARLNQISASTGKVLDWLKSEPKIEETIFPLDPGFAQYELASKQMKGAAGLISFYINMNRVEEIEGFCNRLKHIRMAVSWGGHESLIIPRCSSVSRENFNPDDRTHRMLRLYVGLEDPEYLITDLRQALTGENG
ncbi:aminotransferase class I/II-fold pyridoxal phosphate-dependent enzyme [Pollutibacter soli]|uniref:trans-sulfuration enzyme family protein n=1 Tax=Pollutibacter soli TaxID=3034157 RepID=UPI003013BB31